MATDGQNDDRGGPEYRETYLRFMAITKWAVVGIAGALVVLALFLA